MNGKKAKKVSVVVVVAFLLCGVFGGLVVEQSLAVDVVVGYPSIGALSPIPMADNFGTMQVVVLCPEGVAIHFSSISAYLANTSAGVHAQLGVYNIYDGLICNSSVFQVSGAAWYEKSISCDLTNGTYWLAVACDTGVNLYASSIAGYDADYMNTFPLPAVQVRSAWDTYAVSVFVEGKFVQLVDSSVDVVSWGGLAVSLFLVAVSLGLALKSRSWAVNFLFGLSTVGFLGWTFVNASVEVFGGWLLFMVLIGAILVLVKGAVLVRASGV